MLESNKIHAGDSWKLAEQLGDESVDCIVTSPPYWGLRDYGVDGQAGLEDIASGEQSTLELPAKEET